MSDSRSIFLPRRFYAEGALCNAGMLDSVIMKRVSVLCCTNLCGEAPGEIRKSQQVKVAESRTGDCAWKQGLQCRLLCVQWFQAFQVTGKRGGKGINGHFAHV